MLKYSTGRGVSDRGGYPKPSAPAGKEPSPKRENRRDGPCLTVPGSEDQSKYDVCEVFSPPRMCAAAKRHGLRGGLSIDMAIREPSTGRRFDLRNSKDQKEVKR